jgi:uncharacterized membrane protein
MDLDLALVVLSGTNAAVEAFTAARDRSGQGAPWVSQAGFVEHHNNGHIAVRGTFVGRYVDVDEALGTSQSGTDVGFVVGAAIGVLFGPLGIAEGVVLGPTIGAEVGKRDEIDPEPELLVEQLRRAVPPGSSAIVLIAPGSDVEAFQAALDGQVGKPLTRTLTAEEGTALEAALSTWPEASHGPSLRGERAVEEGEGA